MVNNEKGSVLPRRQRESITTLSSTEDKQELQKKIIESAPLQTSPAQQTNPVSEPPAASVTPAVPEKSDKEKYPWRADTDMSAADLMVVKKKKSYDIPYELVLRLDFIRGKKKPKALGERVKEIQLLTEYLDKATRAELKKLGYEVD
ncbi:TPA: hypothetical protein JI101_16585 [Acinetobacter baumannii]|nr:hypothetical protein [Acinetobacter baumannii]